jgi:hypothetical protein
MIISGVADQLHERISTLVYLDAWVPEDGDSIAALSPEAAQPCIVKGVTRYERYGVPPVPAVVLQVNEQDRAWVDRMCTSQPLATVTEGIRLHGNHLKVKQRVFVLASAWAPTPFRQFYDELQENPDWTLRTIQSGHDAMLDKPSGVASLR